MVLNKYKTVIIITTIVCITIISFGFLIWPGIYEYEKVTRPFYSGQKEMIYKINRITGKATLVVDPLPNKR